MTMIREGSVKVQDIPVGELEPNPWNPNKMTDAMYAKLRAYVEREGFVEPVVVRPLQGGRFQILGGEHRWRVAKDLGIECVPCVVVKLDDRRAKILSINLNELHGETVPSLLAELVHDLSHDLSLEDLATQLPYDLADLRDLTDLLRIPDALHVELEEEAKEIERERVTVVTFPLSREQHEIVTAALDTANTTIGSMSRSAALTHIAREFTRGVRGE